MSFAMPRTIGGESTEYTDEGEFVPWERQPSDTERSFEVFQLYRDLGAGRTCSEAARRLKCTLGNMQHLCWKYDMRARAKAWDDYLDKRYCAEFANRQRGVAKAHLDAAAYIRRKCMKALKRMTMETLIANPAACVALLKEAVRIEANQLHTEAKPEVVTNAAGDTIYFDALPTPKLIEAAEAGLKQLRQQAQRERMLADDSESTARAALEPPGGDADIPADPALSDDA